MSCVFFFFNLSGSRPTILGGYQVHWFLLLEAGRREANSRTRCLPKVIRKTMLRFPTVPQTPDLFILKILISAIPPKHIWNGNPLQQIYQIKSELLNLLFKQQLPISTKISILIRSMWANIFADRSHCFIGAALASARHMKVTPGVGISGTDQTPTWDAVFYTGVLARVLAPPLWIQFPANEPWKHSRWLPKYSGPCPPRGDPIGVTDFGLLPGPALTVGGIR